MRTCVTGKINSDSIVVNHRVTQWLLEQEKWRKIGYVSVTVSAESPDVFRGGFVLIDRCLSVPAM